jgi:hypothetical protein
MWEKNVVVMAVAILSLKSLFLSLFVYRQFALGCVYLCVHVCLSTLEVIITLVDSLTIFSIVLDRSFSLATTIVLGLLFHKLLFGVLSE